MRTANLALLLTLAACSSPETGTPPAARDETGEARTATPPLFTNKPADAGPGIILVADGLIASERLVRFGIPRASAEAAVSSAQGEAIDRGGSSECGAGAIDYTSYPDDLQLTFQDDRFAGWTVNGSKSKLKTSMNIGIGSPRQSLDAAYDDVRVEDSSLGLLFGSGGLTGLLDQDGIEGIVTDIWAGTVCLID